MVKPIVDTSLCKGCGICLSVCALGVFRLVHGKCVVAYPEKCVGCRACLVKCPRSAIRLVPRDVLALYSKLYKTSA